MQRRTPPQTDPKEQEYRAEAARLRLLPRQDQRDIIALYRSVVRDAKVAKRDRDEARNLANALTRLLKLPARRIGGKA